MRKIFADILKEVSEASTQEEKVKILRTNDTTMLRQLLSMALDPEIKFDVKILPYRENLETDGYASNSLYVEVRRLYIFLDSYELKPERKTALLGQILEAIDRADAVALIDVVNKDLSKYGITKELVNVAFPGFIKA
jgi:hypothetical protein